jgi:CheY-like chemotaxis protein
MVPRAISTTRTAGPAATVFVADDDLEMLALLTHALRRDGYDVLAVRSGAQLLEAIERGLVQSPIVRPDLIVTDIRMPGRSGLEVVERLRQAGWDIPVVVITAFGDGETHRAAARLQAAIFDKPFDVDDLRTAVLNLIGRGTRS